MSIYKKNINLFITYNGEKFLQKQLYYSIFKQKDFDSIGEVIICDDCSEDSTIKIIRENFKKK